MCGIAGLYGDFQNQKITIKHMMSGLAHRGPDAEGFFFDPANRLVLGHRRLSILDLSDHANQPFHSKCGRYVMVYNGEVYNYKEVAKSLDVELTTYCDSEVVIEAFAKNGIDFVHQLNGMFAMAIYEKKTGVLHLYRDRFGIKPLFYYFDGVNFAFASESKALLETLKQKKINDQALKDYLFLEYIPGGQSIFDGIHKLKAGHRLTFKDRKIEIDQYYNILDRLNPQNISERESYDQIKALLKGSVDRMRVSDVPIGAFLSGGADSSLVCALFQEISDQPIHSFNIGFENAQFDESYYAQQVANHLNTHHDRLHATQEESLKMLDDVISYYDEPFAATSAFPSMLVCRKASNKVTVALSGDGGDELFMGYGYYKWMDRFTTVSKFGGYAARKAVATILSSLDNRSRRAAQVFDYDDNESAWLHIWSQEQSMFSQKEISHLLLSDYKNSTLLKDWKEIRSLDCDLYTKISLLDIKNYLADNLLYKMDIASMRSGLEVRVPFLDHNLVEAAINLPTQYKINGRAQKYIQKKILEDYLPKELIYRKKWGFPAPVKDWLHADLNYLFDLTLSKQVLKRQDIFNPNWVQHLVNEFKNGRSYHFNKVWALIFFQLWYKKNIDGTIW